MASMSQFSRMLYRRTSAFVTHDLSPVKICRCLYATKKKSVSDLIRWNTENLKLYGAKQKTDSNTKKTAEKDEGELPALDEEIPALVGTSKKKATKSLKTKKITSDSAHIEEVPTLGSTSNKKGIKSTKPKKKVSDNASKKAAKTDVSPGLADGGEVLGDDMEERIMQHMKLRFGDGAFAADGDQEHNAYSVDIPSLLPIPGMERKIPKMLKLSAAAEDVATDIGVDELPGVETEKKESLLTLSQISTLDFVLKFPLFPENSVSTQESLTQAEEFKAMVAACKMRFLPTVNVVLNKTRSELSAFFLQRWREKMIKELGEAGFKKHQEETIWQGTNLHACVQQYLSGIPLGEIQIQEKNQGHWNSISTVLHEVTDVQALETNVTHPLLRYKGTFDCVAKYKNSLCVFDWKTSSKPKPLLANLYDNPLQVAAYLGAINACEEFTSKFGVVEHAVVVVAYANGEVAHVHRLPPTICQHYWIEWCQRLHQFWSLVVAEKGVKGEGMEAMLSKAL